MGESPRCGEVDAHGIWLFTARFGLVRLTLALFHCMEQLGTAHFFVAFPLHGAEPT